MNETISTCEKRAVSLISLSLFFRCMHATVYNDAPASLYYSALIMIYLRLHSLSLSLIPSQSLSLILSLLLCRIFQVVFNGYGCAYCGGLYLRCTRGKVRSDPHNDHLESTNRWIYVQLFSFSVFLNEDTSGQRAQNASIHKSSRNNRTLAYDWRRRASKPEKYAIIVTYNFSGILTACNFFSSLLWVRIKSRGFGQKEINKKEKGRSELSLNLRKNYIMLAI